MHQRLSTLVVATGLFVAALVTTAGASAQSPAVPVPPAPTSPRVFATGFHSPDLVVADISPTGALSAAPGSPHSTGSTDGASVAVSPHGFVYASSFFDNTVRGFRVGADGSLTEVAGSPYAVGVNPAVLAVTADGARLFVTNMGSSSVSVFDVAADGHLTAVTGSPFVGPVSPVGVAVSTDGGHLYVADGASKVWTYSVATDGALSVLDKDAAPGRPLDLALTPDGRFLYVTDITGDTTSGFALAANGTLTPLAGGPEPTPGSPAAVAVSPDGHTLYVGSDGSNQIRGFDIAQDGSLTGAGTTGTQDAVDAIAVAPGGRFVYSVGGDGVLEGFSRSAGGALTALSGSPFDLGQGGFGGERGVAISPDLSPMAALAAPTAATAGTGTNFDASASSDPDGTIARYDWEFGDGTRLADGGATPTHTYATPGSYPVTVTLTDDLGCSTTPVHTGQTASCALTTAATTTRTVTVTPATSVGPGPGPQITAKTTSLTEINSHGWSRTRVTVSFTCTTAPGTTLVTPCPRTLVLHRQHHGLTISRSVTDSQGLSATTTVLVRIDGYPPFVTTHGVRNGATYHHPRRVTCTATDHFTGPVPCHVRTHQVHHADGSTTVRYRATASDEAGNTTVRRGRYDVR